VKCDSCGNNEAVRLHASAGNPITCEKCGPLGHFRFSDVYFNQKKGEQFISNLAHDSKAPLGQVVRSREHKAAIMRELGVIESGDRRHGAR